MGEVYRARDMKLERDVALKVLPESFANDSDRLARFRREAQVLASLNHPNIGGIYGLEEADGMRALVLELVEGPTLADRIARGPVPLDEALVIAHQIAEALEAAHEQGIVHRDLKPANIKLRPDDTVKVLDFGLAKARDPDASITPGDLSQSPTITTPAATRMGMIMGTAAYMSPEQARGKPLDKRTDIWSFGCVLYEMLTGRRPFAGEEVSDVLASVLAREPALTALPATTPQSIRRLLGRCLQKDRNQRLRDIGDARIEIREAQSQAEPDVEVSALPAADGRRRLWFALISALVLITLIPVVAILWVFRASPPVSELRLEITTPPTPVPASLSISPDGRTIAFVATVDNQSRLWLRALDSAAPRPLAGTESAQNPFWSPDGRSIGFFADHKLKRIDIDGGSVRILSNIYRGTGGAWNRDGVILVSSLGDRISRVSAEGGEPVELSGLFQQGSNFSPQFLPDGRRFLYRVRGTPEARGVYVGQIDGGLEPRRLLDSVAGAVYASSGHLLFVRQRTLFAQAFDPVRLELAGNPIAVAEHSTDCACLGLSVSDTGSIAYRTTATAPERQFVWFDRSGNKIGTVGSPSNMASPSLSPDGQRVVGYRGNPVDGNVDIWVLDTKRGASTRFTTDVGDDVAPVWSPHGDRILFSSNRSGTHNLYAKSANAGGNEELMLDTTQEKIAVDWSRDGRFVLFDNHDAQSSMDIWAFPLDGSRKPFPVVRTNFDELRGQFSPDGHWIAYQSDESGRDEIYVQHFPGPSTKWPISPNGGSQVRWRPDGKELFYVALDRRLMAVPFRTSNDGPPDVGAPEALFVPPIGGAVQQADFRPQYMVSSDGQRFLIATVEGGATPPITVILNWNPRPQ
jgi:serine/threonine protein kinase/Tol biopolymer transport system component